MPFDCQDPEKQSKRLDH